MSSDDFGTPTLSPSEVRVLLVGAGAALLLVLVFGFVLALRLAPAMEPAAREAVSEVDSTPVVEGATTTAPSEPAPQAVPGGPPDAGAERIIEEVQAARAAPPQLGDVPGAATTGSSRFGVRVGIFAVPENADRVLLRLQAEGYSPFIVFRLGAEGSLRYVYAGSAPTEIAAASLAEVIRREMGLPTHVEPIDPSA